MISGENESVCQMFELFGCLDEEIISCGRESDGELLSAVSGPDVKSLIVRECECESQIRRVR